MELVRPTLPCRVYTPNDVNDIIECFDTVYKRRHEPAGDEITEEPRSSFTSQRISTHLSHERSTVQI